MTAAAPLPIVMYASPTCEDSDLARQRLQELAIPFLEIDIDADASAARYVEGVNRGFRSTPTIVFGESGFIVVEPTMEELERALRRAGYAAQSGC